MGWWWWSWDSGWVWLGLLVLLATGCLLPISSRRCWMRFSMSSSCLSVRPSGRRSGSSCPRSVLKRLFNSGGQSQW